MLEYVRHVFTMLRHYEKGDRVVEFTIRCSICTYIHAMTVRRCNYIAYAFVLVPVAASSVIAFAVNVTRYYTTAHVVLNHFMAHPMRERMQIFQ